MNIYIEQTELFASRKTRRHYGAIVASDMLAILDASGDWMTRRQLAERGLTPRLCRLARQHAGGRIIAGQRGYRASRHATLEELHEWAGVLHGQATTMLDEVRQLWRVINRRQNASENQETRQ